MKKRTQIYIGEKQQEDLKEISKKTDKSLSELIRNAIDNFLQKNKEQNK